MLRERGVAPATPQGRAVMSRMPALAADVVTRAKEVAALLPLRGNAVEGADLDVVERMLVLAWFLHGNFCAAQPGDVQWSPADAPEVRPLIERFLDRATLKVWLQRKTARPDTVDLRVAELLDTLEPTIVVQE